MTFEASFSNDAEWDDQGRPIVPPGRSIAQTIAEELSSRGASVSRPTQHSFYGWAFDITFEGCEAWSLLQFPGPWLLLIEEKRDRSQRPVGSRSSVPMSRLLREVDEVLKDRERFSSVQWFTKKEYESGSQQGAHTPC